MFISALSPWSLGPHLLQNQLSIGVYLPKGHSLDQIIPWRFVLELTSFPLNLWFANVFRNHNSLRSLLKHKLLDPSLSFDSMGLEWSPRICSATKFCYCWSRDQTLGAISLHDKDFIVSSMGKQWWGMGRESRAGCSFWKWGFFMKG